MVSIHQFCFGLHNVTPSLKLNDSISSASVTPFPLRFRMNTEGSDTMKLSTKLLLAGLDGGSI